MAFAIAEEMERPWINLQRGGTFMWEKFSVGEVAALVISTCTVSYKIYLSSSCYVLRQILLHSLSRHFPSTLLLRQSQQSVVARKLPKRA